MGSTGDFVQINQMNPFLPPVSPPPSYTTLPRRRSSSTPVGMSRSNATPNVMDERTRRRASHHHHHRHSHRYRNGRVRPDTIDKLDDITGFRFHHEGPYDAVYPERNRCSYRSPVEAVKGTNEETLKAIPMYKVMDSIHRHRPIDGVAFYPPGTVDEQGHFYEYKEGDNMMAELEGNFKRNPGMKFTDEDFKNDPFYQGDGQNRHRRMGNLRRAIGSLKRKNQDRKNEL